MPYYTANNTMTHIHHIIPKHMTDGVANNHPDNLIELTVEDHAEAHKQLWLMNRCWQDEIAWLTLSNQIGKQEAIILAVINSHKGIPQSPEWTAKIANANRGKKRSLAFCARMRGKLRTPEVCKKMSLARKGKSLTKEHREALSKARMGKVPWNKGKAHTEEAKEHMRQVALSRKPISNETRTKLSDAAKNQWATGRGWKREQF